MEEDNVVSIEKPVLSAWFGVAIVLQAITGFFYLASGLIIPRVPLAILWVLWAALTFMLFRWRYRGKKTLVVPAATIALWFAYLNLGAAVFGWTA